MAIVTNSNQIKYGGPKYLDPKHDPVANVESLPKSLRDVFEGMTLTVLDSGDGTPKDYWYIGGQWVVKSAGGSGASYTAGQYIDITNNEISVTGITPDDYAKKTDVAADIATAKAGAISESEAWVESQGFLKEVPAEYAKTSDVATSITASENELKSWVGEQDFATERDVEGKADATAVTEEIAAAIADEVARAEAEYAKVEDIATAITEAQAEAVSAATAWTEEQGYLKEIPSQYVTVSELNNEISDAKDEMFSETTVWVEAQGYLKEIPSNLATKAEVASAATEAVAEANAYTDAAVSAITVPEYSLSSVTPTPGFASTYGLMKDGSAVTGSALINIPDTAGATIKSAITTDITIGYVSAGTSFAAGTTIESILRAIFINDSPVAVGYAYYGSLVTPLDETTGITAENIKAYLSHSESAASTTPWRFRVNEGDYQIIVAAPLSFTLDDANDITNAIPYYNEISNNGAPKKTLTIDGIDYGVYYCTFPVEMTRFMMEITLINA